jgi:hypothetical protein
MRDYGITNAAPYATAPAVGPAGDTYYNTTSKQLFLSDGTAWNAAGGVSQTYVDNRIDGVMWKKPCYCATTTGVALSGNIVVDGIDLSVVGQVRVLVKNQANPAQNGIYLNNSGAWVRDTDFDVEGEVPGAVVYVTAGTGQADTVWSVVSPDAIAGFTLGTTAITFRQLGPDTTSYAYLGITSGAIPSAGTWVALTPIDNAAARNGFTVSGTHLVATNAGRYRAHMQLSVSSTVAQAWMLVRMEQYNAANALISQQDLVGTGMSANWYTGVGHDAMFTMSAGDYLIFYVNSNTTNATVDGRSTILVHPISGQKGDTGPQGPDVTAAQSSYFFGLNTMGTGIGTLAFGQLTWSSIIANNISLSTGQSGLANGAIVFSQTGKYLVNVSLGFSVSGGTSVSTVARFNQYSSGGTLKIQRDTFGNPVPAGQFSAANGSVIIDAVAGDYVQIYAQPNGATITVDTTRAWVEVVPVGGVKGDIGPQGPDVTAVQSSYWNSLFASPASFTNTSYAQFLLAAPIKASGFTLSAGRAVCSNTGRYRVGWHLSGSSSAGSGYLDVQIQQIRSGSAIVSQSEVGASVGTANYWQPADGEIILDLVAGDAVQLNLAVNSGQWTPDVNRCLLSIIPVGGVKGDQGPSGGPVPTGGTINQIIRKTGAPDFAVGWANPGLYSSRWDNLQWSGAAGIGSVDANLATFTCPYAGWLELTVSPFYFGFSSATVNSGWLMIYTNSKTFAGGGALQTAPGPSVGSVAASTWMAGTGLNFVVPVNANDSIIITLRGSWSGTGTCWFNAYCSTKYFIS